MDSPTVTLRSMRDEDVPTVVGVAVGDAHPDDVMPPDTHPDPGAWTERRVAAFAAFLRTRLSVLDDGRRECAYVIEVDGRPAGVARLLPSADGDAPEVGVWLTGAARGRGVGRRVLELLVDEARAFGAAEIVAVTTAGNAAALGVLRRGGARFTTSLDRPGVVNARLALGGSR